jgi:glycosyltransferase involved in cell wall biosynthesis
MSVNYQDKAFGDQHGITAYSIIPNGADEGEFSSPQIGFREKFGINTKYLLICVANFYRSKGQDLVVNVFKRLNRDDVTLILIGNPVQDRNIWRQRYYLEMRLKSMMSSNINILEDITREWVVSAYKEADIFVFGSQIECSPLVIQEAMAAGIPFVSTHCGDVSDYERFGDVVAGEDEMVERLNHLLDADELRSRMGTEAKNYWREHHTWDIIATQYEDMYKKLID